MLSERRTRLLRDLAARGPEATTMPEACAFASDVLGRYELDVPFTFALRMQGARHVSNLTSLLQPGPTTYQ